MAGSPAELNSSVQHKAMTDHSVCPGRPAHQSHTTGHMGAHTSAGGEGNGPHCRAVHRPDAAPVLALDNGMEIDLAGLGWEHR